MEFKRKENIRHVKLKSSNDGIRERTFLVYAIIYRTVKKENEIYS